MKYIKDGKLHTEPCEGMIVKIFPSYMGGSYSLGIVKDKRVYLRHLDNDMYGIPTDDGYVGKIEIIAIEGYDKAWFEVGACGVTVPRSGWLSIADFVPKVNSDTYGLTPEDGKIPMFIKE